MPAPGGAIRYHKALQIFVVAQNMHHSTWAQEYTPVCKKLAACKSVHQWSTILSTSKHVPTCSRVLRVHIFRHLICISVHIFITKCHDHISSFTYDVQTCAQSNSLMSGDRTEPTLLCLIESNKQLMDRYTLRTTSWLLHRKNGLEIIMRIAESGRKLPNRLPNFCLISCLIPA